MRITAELLSQAHQRTNPLGERELVLQGLGIPGVENGAATRDYFDCWDLSNNRIAQLDNFPKLLRLSNLLCSGNLIQSVDGGNLGTNLPNLKYLDLSRNNISRLSEVAKLGKACAKLESLSLHQNPVTRRQHYRLFTVHRIPSLKYLDFARITAAERDHATKLANSAAGAELASDIEKEMPVENSFVPGAGLSSTDGRSFVSASFSVEEKGTIRQLLRNASSVREVEEIENAVRNGVVPKL